MFKCMDLLSVLWKWSHWTKCLCLRNALDLNKHHFLFSWINLLADVWHSSGIYTQLKNTDEGRAELNFLLFRLYWTDNIAFKRNMNFSYSLQGQRDGIESRNQFPPVTKNSILKSCSVLYLLLFWFFFFFFSLAGLCITKQSSPTASLVLHLLAVRMH